MSMLNKKTIEEQKEQMDLYFESNNIENKNAKEYIEDAILGIEKNKEEIKGSLAKYSKYIKHWEEGEKGDVDSTVQTIRKLTEYAEDVYGVASHI